MSNSIGDWLKEATAQLTNHSDSPRIDAEVLLSHALDKNRTYLYSHPEKVLSSHTIQTLSDWLAARIQGKPIAYITGKQSFWKFELLVNEHTLIPRPDTETLVEAALERLKPIRSPLIYDLGTGSGAIACALAYERPDAEIIATDLSADALAVAKRNAKNLALKHITFIHADWYQSLPAKKADAIVSNPPYISADDEHLESKVKQFEPQSALLSNKHGLSDIEAIIKKSFDYLTKEGILLLEIGHQQFESAEQLLRSHGYKDIHAYKDLQDIKRVICGLR